MDQAINGSISPRPSNQPTSAHLFDADTLQRLQGISALLDFVAHGASDIGGPPLWEALAYLALDFANCMQDLEARAERLEQCEH
jgi:hypothetical protein